LKRLLVQNVASIALGVALFGLYATFMFYSLIHGLLYPASTAEAIILAIQPVKLAVILGTKRFRWADAASIFDLLMVEILFLPLLVVILYFGHGTSPAQVIDIIFPAVPVAEAAFFPPYTIFRLSLSLRNGIKASRGVVGVATHFGALAYLAQVAAATQVGHGLGSFTVQVANVVSGHSMISGGTWESALAVELSGIAVYLTTVTYALLNPAVAEVRLRETLGFALVGTVVVALWILGIAPASYPALTTLMAPALLLVFAVWWLSRA
jgi:hypothetical protein